MKKTKEKILRTAHRLFNEQGVAQVSLRQIAAAIPISHTNLIYHFPNQQAIIAALHEEILAEALRLNQEVQGESHVLKALFQSARLGFKVLYDYRFFMLDLNLIMRADPVLKEKFVQIEQLRAQMYQEVIDRAVQEKLLREADHPGMWADLIQHIRIYSDYWLASAEIYDSRKPAAVIADHARLLMGLFYPYLTRKGKEDWEEMMKAA
ncbi:MAG: TetR/AcrR family transcriptional regulator [Bacteroidota bacterium]